MFVKSVFLNNFRNYKEKTVRFSEGLNVIAGPNATGKTNLLESVYMCGLGNSPRVSRDKDVIMWGQTGAYIRLELQKKFRLHTIEMYIDSREKKRVAIDGIPISRLSQLIGTLGVVFFSPDELKLVKDAPAERRRFMDVSLCQQSSKYLFSLSRYNAVLLRRNKLLKTLPVGEDLKNALHDWDLQLAQEGARVIKARYSFARELKAFLFPIILTELPHPLWATLMYLPFIFRSSDSPTVSMIRMIDSQPFAEPLKKSSFAPT